MNKGIITTLITICFPLILVGQEQLFSLQDCISYALEHNTDIGRADNEIKSQSAYLEQKRAERNPNLFFSGSGNFSSGNRYFETNTIDDWNRDNNSNLNLSLTSSLTLYNGAKLKNAILQGQTNLAAAESDIVTRKELISLEVLSAFINVMMAKEQVKNSESLLEATEKQLEQATIRREVGVLSPSDLLNIKSQYATDKAALIASQSDLRISIVSLMQRMNLPIDSAFDIEEPDIEALLLSDVETDANKVYNVALGLQPGIKTAELDLKSAEMEIKLAKAAALPVLLLNAGLNSWYNNQTNINLPEQAFRQITPSIGLTLSVPIFQRKQVKNNVTQAFIRYENFNYNLVDIKNDLRKAIEQACTDLQTAKSTYLSRVEQLKAEQVSYRLAEEMFSQGMLNSIELLTSKNNLFAAQNNLTQAKYNVVLQNRIINYYMGSSMKFLL